MASFNLVNKILNTSGEMLEKIKGSNESEETAGKELSLGAMKKKISELVQEKSKLYGFIGMEVCDLNVAGKIQVPQLESYLEKMETLDLEIAQLEAQKSEKEKTAQKNNICDCGYKLNKKDKFCPGCGKKAEILIIVCTCGRELDKKDKFCPNCGTKVEELLLSENRSLSSVEPNAEIIYTECVCGAKVDSTQLMCMECGRRIIK